MTSILKFDLKSSIYEIDDLRIAKLKKKSKVYREFFHQNGTVGLNEFSGYNYAWILKSRNSKISKS